MKTSIQNKVFMIEGMEKVRDVIEKNRTRKLTKHKKLSNNKLSGCGGYLKCIRL
jgi:hypothetical protein